MKSILYILIALFAGTILLTTLPPSCNKQEKQTLTLECASQHYTALQLRAQKTIIDYRLKDYGIKDADLYLDESAATIQIALNASENTAKLSSLFLSKGEIEFYETIDRLSLIEKLNSESELFQLMDISKDEENPDRFSGIFGYCKPENVEKVNRFLNDHYVGKSGHELNFLWNRIPNKEGNYTLYILSNQSVLDKGSIETVEVKTDNENQTNELHFSFNKPGTRLWSEITKRNIGKSIAITLDKQVLQAPRVMNEIHEGRAAISGNYTLDELNLMKSMIVNANLILDFKVKK